jgi:hypothetical protein
MILSFRSISSLFFILLLGCSSGQETQEQEDEPTEEEMEAHEERKEKLQEADLKKRIDKEALDSIQKKQKSSKKKGAAQAFLYHERTPCFGTCPIYTLRVQENGKAKLKVEQNMELEEGSYQGNVGESKLDRVEKKARSIGFFELKKSYDDKDVTDIPTHITELRIGDKEHRVRNRHGAPEELEELESLLHGIAKNTDWRPAPSDE